MVRLIASLLSGTLLKLIFILRFPKNQSRLSVGKSCGQVALIRAESEHGGRSKILLGGAFGAREDIKPADTTLCSSGGREHWCSHLGNLGL